MTTDLTHTLNHVLWLGGSPCAGKSSISAILAARFDLTVYHVDEAFGHQMARLDAARQPALVRWLHSSWDERWMQPLDTLLQEAIACYSEHFELVREDVEALAVSRPLLVEGTALLPCLVAALGTPSSRGLWVVPDAEFQWRHYAPRAFVRDILAECTDPTTAFNNWMARDAAFARWVSDEATALGYAVLWVDGSASVEATAGQVEAHFRLNRSGD